MLIVLIVCLDSIDNLFNTFPIHSLSMGAVKLCADNSMSMTFTHNQLKDLHYLVQTRMS